MSSTISKIMPIERSIPPNLALYRDIEEEHHYSLEPAAIMSVDGKCPQQSGRQDANIPQSSLQLTLHVYMVQPHSWRTFVMLFA